MSEDKGVKKRVVVVGGGYAGVDIVKRVLHDLPGAVSFAKLLQIIESHFIVRVLFLIIFSKHKYKLQMSMLR